MEYDVIFMSYGETNSEKNFELVKDKAPHAKRVEGVKGIGNAHRACAEISKTDMLWIVDADAELANYFEFDYEPKEKKVHSWLSFNPVNSIVCNHGAVKLYPTESLKIELQDWFLDFNTSKYPMSETIYVKEISNTTAFNSDPFSTWRAAFKQTVKYNYWMNTIGQYDFQNKINIWCSVGEDKPFGEYAIRGAKRGCQFYKENDKKTLHLINDYVIMEELFNE